MEALEADGGRFREPPEQDGGLADGRSGKLQTPCGGFQLGELGNAGTWLGPPTPEGGVERPRQ
jgi:hypothetical protein